MSCHITNANRRTPSTIPAMMSGEFLIFAKGLGAFIATACPVPCLTPLVFSTNPVCGCSICPTVKRGGGRAGLAEVAGGLTGGVVKPDFGL